MLADARFLVGAIAVPKGQPVFRWQVAQEDHRFPSREQCHKDWTAAGTDTLGVLFTGCHAEYLQPDAYYVNSREADRRIRPLALKAAVTKSEEHTSELQSLMRISYAVFCLKKKNNTHKH